MDNRLETIVKQMEFVQATNQLLMRNQAMLEEFFKANTQKQDKAIRDLTNQVQTLTKIREQDRRALHGIQMAREQDRAAKNMAAQKSPALDK